MLTYLRVRNLAVIRDVEIEFGPGLNALTGETGAGKSILVDAVGMLLGDRADAQQIRHGQDKAIVEGQFRAGSAASALLREEGLAGEDGELVVRRELATAVPNRVFINGNLSTLSTLRRLMSFQVALHGQSRHLVLATSPAQRRFLDSAALPRALREDLARAWQDLVAAAADREAHQERVALGAREMDLLRFQIGEIEAVAPRAGEDDELHRQERLLSTCQERAGLVDSLVRELMEDDDAVAARLSRIGRRLAALVDLDPDLQALNQRLAGAILEIDEVAREVRGAAPGEPEEPGRLEEVQARLLALQDLCRKYGGTLAEVLATAGNLRADLLSLEDSEETAAALRAAEVEAARHFHIKALDARKERRATARQLERGVTKELQALDLSGARLEIDIAGTPPGGEPTPETVRAAGGPGGYDRVHFRFTAHAGEPARELARVASGGELSRLMLALTLVAEGRASDSGPRTFIFDEVDAGVGGDTAWAVGDRLRQVASHHQVVCVTHLPQIAALAAWHLQVSKRIHQGHPGTGVKILAEGERVAELARMLGGGNSPDTARRHARALLAAAQGQGTTSALSPAIRQRAKGPAPWV
jgi:DNA repair protein RecN (Recombination protein N)